MEFELPRLVSQMVRARNDVRDYYQSIVKASGGSAQLSFTLDGNLVGDIGEALSVAMYGITLVNRKSMQGIDGHAPDGRSVQIKATATGRGPAFRNVGVCADHLLFFDLDLENCRGVVVFNGPEHYARDSLKLDFTGQRMLSPKQIRAADARVLDHERLIPTGL